MNVTKFLMRIKSDVKYIGTQIDNFRGFDNKRMLALTIKIQLGKVSSYSKLDYEYLPIDFIQRMGS